jgi:hypothetical protein
MSNYISSFWRSMSGGWSSRGAGFRTAGPASAAGCSCKSDCRCAAGAPCRCRKSCSCQSPGEGAPGNWLESAETSGESQEYGRRGGARSYGGRAWRRPSYRQPYRLPNRQPQGSYRGGSRYGQQQSPQYGGSQSFRSYWAPRQQWNNAYANRFGWNRFTGGIGRMIGCPGCSPGSFRFSNSLSRWQSRLGLRPTGVLTPGLWNWMRPRLPPPFPVIGAGATPGPYPPMAPPPPDATEPEPSPDAPAADAPAPDAPADAPPEDPPAADGAAEEYGAGFRRRRHPRRQPGYSIY